MYSSATEYENHDYYNALESSQRGLDYNIEGCGTSCYADGDSQDCSYNFGHHVGVVAQDMKGTPVPNYYACPPSGYENAYKMGVNASKKMSANNGNHHHYKRGSNGGGCLMLIIGLILLGLILFMIVQFCGAK